ncbi:MAG: hypothetical protein JW941_05465 [Candidatus Coatesbacteria bacterium]|nr:hypothetical protein [Candidatus Coatesbacteria bacterium]
MSSMEQITIDPCPICGGSHTYPLSVHQSVCTRGLGADSLKSVSNPGLARRRVTRFLMCPVKHVMFQATLELPDGLELTA